MILKRFFTLLWVLLGATTGIWSQEGSAVLGAETRGDQWLRVGFGVDSLGGYLLARDSQEPSWCAGVKWGNWTAGPLGLEGLPSLMSGWDDVQFSSGGWEALPGPRLRTDALGFSGSGGAWARDGTSVWYRSWDSQDEWGGTLDLPPGMLVAVTRRTLREGNAQAQVFRGAGLWRWEVPSLDLGILFLGSAGSLENPAGSVAARFSLQGPGFHFGVLSAGGSFGNRLGYAGAEMTLGDGENTARIRGNWELSEESGLQKTGGIINLDLGERWWALGMDLEANGENGSFTQGLCGLEIKTALGPVKLEAGTEYMANKILQELGYKGGISLHIPDFRGDLGLGWSQVAGTKGSLGLKVASPAGAWSITLAFEKFPAEPEARGVLSWSWP